MTLKLRQSKTTAIAAALMGVFLYGTVQAQTYNFIWNGGGSAAYWERTDSTGWLLSDGVTPANAYPNAAGVSVLISKATLGANQTISLTNSIMLGRLDIGNTVYNASTTRNYTIADATGTGGGYLIFTAYNSGNAQINEVANIYKGDLISAAVKLQSSLDISNASNFTISLSGGLSSYTAGEKVVTVKSGKVYIYSVENGSGTISLLNNGGILTLANAYHTGSTTVNNGGTTTITKLVGASNSFVGATSTLAFNGLMDSYTGNIDIASTGNLVFNLTETSSYTSIISGAGNLIKLSGGHLTLTGNNSYTGDTILRAGAIKISSDKNVGNGGKFIFENSGWAQLEFTANTTLAHAIALNNSSAALIGVTEGLTATITGPITGAGTGGIQKRFGGTLVLDGTGSFSGTVSVGSGTLIINGDYSNATGNMLVVSTASLGGSGIYGGAAQLNGTITPNSALSLGNTTLSSLSSLVLTLNKSGATTSADHLNVSGDLIIESNGANLAVSMNAGAAPITLGDIFFIIVNDGSDTVTGNFYSLNGVVTDLSEGATFDYNGATVKISYQADSALNSISGGNDVALQVIAIPEPAIAAALLGLIGLTLAVRRRH